MQLHAAYSVYKNDYIKLSASARISSPIASAAFCVAFAWFPTYSPVCAHQTEYRLNG